MNDRRLINDTLFSCLKRRARPVESLDEEDNLGVPDDEPIVLTAAVSDPYSLPVPQPLGPRKRNHFARLPKEILGEVFRQLALRDIFRCMQVCKKWSTESVSRLEAIVVTEQVHSFEAKSAIKQAKSLVLGGDIPRPLHRNFHKIAWDIAYQCAASLEVLVLESCVFLQYKTLRRLLFKECKFPNLKLLNLSKTNIGDKAVQNLARNMPRLEAVHIAQCPITADALPWLVSLHNLEFVSVSSQSHGLDLAALDAFCLERFKLGHGHVHFDLGIPNWPALKLFTKALEEVDLAQLSLQLKAHPSLARILFCTKVGVLASPLYLLERAFGSFAASPNALDCAKLLLSYLVEPSGPIFQFSKVQYPLTVVDSAVHWALDSRNAYGRQLLEELLLAGANVSLLCQGTPPLLKAVNTGWGISLTFASMLLSHGADVTATYSSSSNLPPHTYYSNSRPVQGDNCLHVLFKQAHEHSPELQSLIRDIVDKDSSLINKQNSRGETPLWLALSRNLDSSIVRLCLQQGGSLLKASITFTQLQWGLGRLLETERLDSDNFELFLHQHDSALIEHYLEVDTQWKSAWKENPQMICYVLIARFEEAIRSHSLSNEDAVELRSSGDSVSLSREARKRAFGELVLVISDSVVESLVNESV